MNKKLILILTDQKEKLMDISSALSPPIGLGIVAASTPDSWDVEIIDENVQRLEDLSNLETDLVGISSITGGVNKAYKLATTFRNGNIPVVMGGVHVSLIPDEALNYGFTDSVVIGEAEHVWPLVIKDFENNRLKPKYYHPLKSLERVVAPRRDLFSGKYQIDAIYTSRGCPKKCDFCAASRFYGIGYRQRPIEEVVAELETLTKPVFFVDDNFIGYEKNCEERAITLFRTIVESGLKIPWYSQVSLNIIDNEEVLKWAKESGAQLFYIGFESVNENTLKKMNKEVNIFRNYTEAIKKIHDCGIGIIGSFMFGYDGDTPETFEETLKFIQDSDLDALAFFISTPYPRTPFYNCLQSEGRLLRTNYPEDWSYYTESEVVFRPRGMTIKQLEEGVKKVVQETLNSDACLRRKERTESLLGSDIANKCYEWNYNLGKGWGVN